MSDSDALFDNMAKAIFAAALYENRCGELLNALHDGGTATVDVQTHKLVIISGAAIEDVMERSFGGES